MDLSILFKTKQLIHQNIVYTKRRRQQTFNAKHINQSFNGRQYISEASIPSTSGSNIESQSFNSTSFSAGSLIMTSSPKPKTKPATKKHLRILNMNIQSLKKKGKQIEAIIESTEPDIIIGTETWLDSNIKSSEIIPDYFQYDMERRDRPKDPHGGVMIAAKQSLQLENITKGEDIELITGTII